MSDPFADIMAPLGRLRDRVNEALAKNGLAQVLITFTPGSSIEGPHEVNIVARLAPGATDDTTEAFTRVLREAAEAEAERRSQATLDELRGRLDEGPEGFL